MSCKDSRMKALSLFLLAVTSGCTTAPNPKSCADDFCHDPALPFCDADGSISGTPNTCVAVACTANEFAGCRGDEVLTCNAAGSDYDVTLCEFGCNEEAKGCNACVPGSPDCTPQIIPVHMPAACNALASQPALVIASSMTLDTNDDNECTGGVIDQTMGPDVCVLRHSRINLEAGAEITVVGSRALALVSDEDLLIDGVLDIGANALTNGPGGGVFRSGTSGPDNEDGSGGAGFKTAGGAGGDPASNGGANNGGAAAANPMLSMELVGGTTGTKNPGFGAEFGGAGGAANLISCRGSVVVAGLIDVGGGGGAGGFWDGAVAHPPGAGGSGGYIVMQGMNVNVIGEVYANGGGGGGGQSGLGADGTRSATVAAVGGTSAHGAIGGAGGRRGAAPGVGSRTMSPLEVTGGAGGGSTGFIQTYTPEGVLPMLSARGISPALEPNGTVQTR